MFNYIYRNTTIPQSYKYRKDKNENHKAFHPCPLLHLIRQNYLMINIGVLEWKIIFFAILGLNNRANMLRL